MIPSNEAKSLSISERIIWKSMKESGKIFLEFKIKSKNLKKKEAALKRWKI